MVRRPYTIKLTYAKQSDNNTNVRKFSCLFHIANLTQEVYFLTNIRVFQYKNYSFTI